jgi:hypothetical protein
MRIEIIIYFIVGWIIGDIIIWCAKKIVKKIKKKLDF